MSDHVKVPVERINRLREELEHGEPTDWYSAGMDILRSIEASPEPESAVPVGILKKWKEPVQYFKFFASKPGYDLDSGEYSLYVSQPKQEQWIKFDYDNPPDDGVYWLEVEYPEWDVDVDDYGKTVGKPTGETIKAVFLGRVDMFDDNPDGEPDVYHVIEDVNGELKPDVDWVILRYAKPQPPGE